jgi:hypothetical protein
MPGARSCRTLHHRQAAHCRLAFADFPMQSLKAVTAAWLLSREKATSLASGKGDYIWRAAHHCSLLLPAAPIHSRMLKRFKPAGPKLSPWQSLRVGD